MADTTMCQDGECASASECHRYCAIPSDRQSYAEFWRDRESGEFSCPHFVPRRAGDRTQHQQIRITAMKLRVVQEST